MTITRRWAIELAEAVGLEFVLNWVESVFDVVFQGVTDVYSTAENAATGSAGSVDLVLSILFTVVYIGGFIAILYATLNSVGWVKRWATNRGFTDSAKLYTAIGGWLALTVIDSVFHNQVFVWKMTETNAEWIHVSRQAITGQLDAQAGLDVVAFGLLDDPVIEAGAMATLSMIVIAYMTYQYIPSVGSPLKLFVGVFTGSLLSYVVANHIGYELFPIGIRPVFIAHVLFVWLIVGTVFAWSFGSAFRKMSDFFAGERHVFQPPDRIKYVRDGTVALAFFLAFASAEYTAVLAILAWVSYKIAMDNEIIDDSVSGGGAGSPPGDDCFWDEDLGDYICPEDGDL